MQTLQMMSKAGRISRPAHISAIVAKLLEGTAHGANAVGRIRMMEGEPGSDVQGERGAGDRRGVGAQGWGGGRGWCGQWA